VVYSLTTRHESAWCEQTERTPDHNLNLAPNTCEIVEWPNGIGDKTRKAQSGIRFGGQPRRGIDDRALQM
jgi:hypothetical protein